MTDLLEISLLGRLVIKRDGLPVTALASRKAEALLVYLVCTGQPHSREVLADLFWDERSQSQAMANLRVLLSSLRQTLGPYLTITRQTVAFNQASPYYLDAAQLEGGLAEARLQQRQNGDLSPEGVAQLAQTLALYQGDFLVGFYLRDSQGFEEWLVTERERLRLRVIEAFQELVEGYLKLREYPAGIEPARRLLALDPLQEVGHRQLMRLLLYSGQRNAALAQYDICRRILAEELGVEPMPETTALYEQIRLGELSRGAGEQRSGGEIKVSPPLPSSSTSSYTDWGEVPEIGAFYGRQTELAQLEQWLVADHCRLVAVLGMGGVGKTALAVKLTQGVAGQFQYVIWRSLLNAPPFTEILRGCLQFLSAQQVTHLPDSLDEQLTLLLDHLRQQRCLIILDNLEGILQGGERAGSYRPGYEAYGQLIQQVGEAKHQSCLLLTSRERPSGFRRLEGDLAWMRSLQLAGLGVEAGQEFLKGRDLSGSAEAKVALIERYSGNPLALRLVTETIHELFEGDIAAFLTEETLVFDDIRDVLDQQFARLSTLEQEIIVWLTIEREAASAEALWDNLVRPESRRAFLEALRSLQRRSLVEKSNHGFTLQNVVIEYTTDHLTTQVCREIETGTLDLFISHALIKAQAKEYVRQSQTRLILQPLADRLVAHLGRAEVETKLKYLLATARAKAPLSPSYTGGNILNLLLYLGCDVRGYDFSRLTLWQAYLRGVSLPAVNFAGTDLSRSVFSDTFGSIKSVAFSPDGQLLTAGTDDGEILLWQITVGQPAGVLKGYPNCVWSVAFSPDGETLASSGDDQTVRLWDVHTGRCLNILPGHPNYVWSVAFSPNGEILASGGADQTVRLWDVHTGQCLNILHGHTQGVSAVAFSPNGEILASSGSDRTVRLWDVHTGQCLNTLPGHTQGVSSVAFSPDGETLASSGADQTIRLWDVHTGQCLNTLPGHTQGVRSITFSPDGGLLASGSEDQMVRLWDLSTGQCLNILPGHTDRVSAVAFSPNGETLASGGEDQTVRLWDVSTGQCLNILPGYTHWVSAVAFSPDGETLASGGADQTVRLWDVSTGQCLNTLPGHTQGVSAVAFSPDGCLLASGGDDWTVRLWDVHTGQCLNILPGHTDRVTSVAFSPDGGLLASGSEEDQTVRLWDVPTGQCLNILHGHTARVMSVAFSPNGETLASGSYDQTVRLWNVSTGQCLNILSGHTHWVYSVAFSPDGRVLASGSDDQTVRLWDVHTGQYLNALHGHTDDVMSVAFSPNGETLASGSYDQTVRLWDVHTGQCLNILSGHTQRVRSVTFSPDGGLLASGGSDQMVRLWDMQTGECLKTFRPDRPYERMNITGATGLTEAQKVSLRRLGAVED